MSATTAIADGGGSPPLCYPELTANKTKCNKRRGLYKLAPVFPMLNRGLMLFRLQRSNRGLEIGWPYPYRRRVHACSGFFSCIVINKPF